MSLVSIANAAPGRKFPTFVIARDYAVTGARFMAQEHLRRPHGCRQRMPADPAARTKEITMSDYDPDRMDPRRPGETNYTAGSGFNWNWIIGGIAALVVLLVALSFMGSDDRTADTGQPSATTGQASPPAKSTPSPAPATPRPASPNQ
jgi:hypothetical protein